MKLCSIIILILSWSAFSQEVTPTSKVNQSIEFNDDLDFQNLELAIQRQLNSYEQVGLKGTIKFGGQVYPKSVLRDSLVLLRDLAIVAKTCLKTFDKSKCMAEFNQDMNEKFLIYRPIPKKNENGYNQKEQRTQYTSYYSPDLVGSRVKTEKYKNPIYSLPNPEDRGFSRVEIDYKGALDGKGYELFYVQESHYDLYLLHVQGGGRVKVMNPDGTFEYKYLSYAGANGRTFKMVYHYMQEKGYLKGDSSIPAQRRFFEENPDKEEEVFSICPSYIYFRESDHEPVGVNNIPLTESRSLAIDIRVYKTMGLINFVKTNKPVGFKEGKVEKVPFSRFFIAQDTGGAIRGNARCDLYAGYGPLAELSAYNTNDLGEQYFLIKK